MERQLPRLKPILSTQGSCRSVDNIASESPGSSGEMKSTSLVLIPRGAFTSPLICSATTNDRVSITTVTRFWSIMNALLNTIFDLYRKVPFTTSTGLNAEIWIPGMIPASSPVKRMKQMQVHAVPGVRSFSSIILPRNIDAMSSWNRNESPSPMRKDIRTIRMDSTTSLIITSVEELPSSLLVAISLALIPVFATVRLI